MKEPACQADLQERLKACWTLLVGAAVTYTNGHEQRYTTLPVLLRRPCYSLVNFMVAV